MLSLQMKDGEYLTIGEDIVIQIFTTAAVKVSVQAPKELTILRGELLERSGENRPDCLCEQSHKTKKSRKTLEVSNG